MRRTPPTKISSLLPEGVGLGVRAITLFLLILLFPNPVYSQNSPFDVLIRNFPEQLIPLKLPLKKPKIRVIKAQRLLYLYEDDKLLRIYPIGLGFNPQGDKKKEGDGRTPEGIYFISEKNPKSKFYLSLAISYPNTQDAKWALREGRIQSSEFEDIQRATNHQATPPWKTPLGGEIFIHGNGSRSDWTDGCIALENFQMKELYQAIPRGTPVEILP